MPQILQRCEFGKMSEMSYKGIVIFDVDGVLFKDIFLKRIVRSRGLKKYLKILLLGIQYYIDKISIQHLLREGYKLAGHIHKNEALMTADKIRRVTHIRKTIAVLKRESYFVSIISAGIPNFVLRDLARDIGADHYAGIRAEKRGDIIRVDTETLVPKIQIVDGILKKLGLEWKDVISVGDDPNNAELLQKSSIGIGFNPSALVRKHSDVVIEGNNFLEILPYIIPSNHLPKNMRRARFYWKRELFRKGIHALGSLFPFVARFHTPLSISILSGAVLLYGISEIFRYMGMSFSPIALITRKAQRMDERRGIIIGPIFLGLGILLTICVFDYSAYLPAVLIVSVSDCLSAIIGILFGKVYIFRSHKRTIEGSFAFFAASSIILFLTVDPALAIPAAVIATILELIPVYNLDNLLVPFGTALFLHLMK
jgi:phytol kinase